MMRVSFTVSGSVLVPAGTTEIPGLANQLRLPGGQIVSIQPVIEMASGIDADDHRDLSYDEAVALDLYLECEARTVEIDEESG